MSKQPAFPAPRGGSVTEVVRKNIRVSTRLPEVVDDIGSLHRWLGRFHDDENLAYLRERARNYADLADARFGGAIAAHASGDGEGLADVAHSLTDAASRLGAVRLMRLGIALQMLARRGLFAEARHVLDELGAELSAFKQNLIAQAG